MISEHDSWWQTVTLRPPIELKAGEHWYQMISPCGRLLVAINGDKALMYLRNGDDFVYSGTVALQADSAPPVSDGTCAQCKRPAPRYYCWMGKPEDPSLPFHQLGSGPCPLGMPPRYEFR